METCYKLLPAGLMRSLQLVSSRFEIETEITGKLLRSGERIMEIPIRYQARKRGKKIGVKDGIQAIWNLMRWKYFK
jgi:hypothetical protein